MSAPPKSGGEPITSKAQLVAYLAAGAKPRELWRIGTEHEKFGFNVDDLRPLPYDGPSGIRALLTAMQRYGWQPVLENGNVIALSHGACAISLEPGGQLELSGAPLETLHETCCEVQEHLTQVRTLGDELGIGMLGMGFQPKWRREDIEWMPKGRYRIMRAQMEARGKLGVDMMLRTCTVQVNLDFGSEADMAAKMRIGMALQPIATALFADSPFTEGKPNGFLSYRSQVWTDTDPDRTGILPFALEPGMSFEHYVDYMLDVPMYFVWRNGGYVDARGQSFRDFMAGRLPALPGEVPLIGDWADHLTTAFPEVRLKRYIEMRGADGGPWDRLCALPALWVGLLYDTTAQDAALDLVKDWTVEEVAALRRAVPRSALGARLRGATVREIALEVLAIARDGLTRRARTDQTGQNEAHFLNTLQHIAATGVTPAEEKLEAFRTRWGGSVDPVFREFAYERMPMPCCA